ncbi:UDP-glycosyltransferase 92A1-like [Tripterygium wilfordii]|uniref:UDP-glycosyltransferase 92A1-like n=1 Tax=Tripterygium wilfordii TaxID=458696 RepID=UPI0018F82512|nr:UDP-glycosyltransferase 92A1-like [Tripterygium wilfordii]
MATEREARQIVMFPFMAQGHMNPFMALARQLEKRPGYTITVVNTPLNIQKLKSSLPSESSIQLAEIPFQGTKYGLPPGVENTDSASYESMVCLLEASEALRSPFRDFIIDMTKQDGHAPVCIICDVFLAWTVEVAHELGIYHSVFITGPGYSMATYVSVSLNMLQCKTEEKEFTLPDFPEAAQIQLSQLGNDLKFTDGTDSWYLFRVRQFAFCLRSDAILLNSIEGLGQTGVTYFRRKMGGRPCWPIGPVSSIMQKKVVSETDSSISWLNSHQPGSVLYVSFGSQYTILPSQMVALARGIEASGKAFIWVVRSPIGFDPNEQIRSEWFPDGFEHRIKEKNQGFLIHKWGPQRDILSHKSVGAFLSHCGWNSMLESLCSGTPIIGWPLAAEQFFNSHMLEKEVGVCVEVARGIESAIIEPEHIAGVINMVLGNTEKGEDMRRKASEMKEKMGEAIREGDGYEGPSLKAMTEFLNAAELFLFDSVHLFVMSALSFFINKLSLVVSSEKKKLMDREIQSCCCTSRCQHHYQEDLVLEGKKEINNNKRIF